MLLIGSIETNLHSGAWFSTKRHRLFQLPQIKAVFSTYNYTPSRLRSRASFERGVDAGRLVRSVLEKSKLRYMRRIDALVPVYFVFPGPHKARPGFAPVCSPSLMTCTPFTKTCFTPVAY